MAINFLTAEVTIKMSLVEAEAKRTEQKALKSVRKIEAAEKQAYAHRNRLRAIFDTAQGRAIEDNKNRAIRAAKAAAKAIERAHKRMVAALKRNYLSLQRMATRVFSLMGAAARRAFRTVTHYAKLAALALLAAGAASVKMAMDAEESENLFEVSMGKMAGAAREFSQTVSDALFINEFEIRKNVGVFNVMFLSMGHGTEEAYKMATGLTQLSYDMASFFNLKPEEAFTKIRSGIVGMSRPLKDLGILLEETTVKQYALNAGIFDGIGNMTEIQKVQARYGALMEQTTLAQGDMLRTLDSTTNVFRSLWSVIQETAIGIGQKLMPAVTNVGIKMRDWLVNNQKEVEDWAQVWVDKIEVVVKKLMDLGAVFSGKGFVEGMKTAFNAMSPVFFAIVDSFTIIGQSAAMGFMRAFGEEMGWWLLEWGKPEGILGKLSMAIPVIGASRLALMKAGIDLITNARLEEPIRVATRLRMAWEGVGEAVVKAIPSGPYKGMKMPEIVRFSRDAAPTPPSQGLAATGQAGFNWNALRDRMIEDQKKTDAILIGMAEERAEYEIGQRKAVADAEEELGRKQVEMAEAGIRHIQSLNFLTHTERLDQMDELIEIKRGMWAEEGEAMKLLAEERQRYADQHKEGWAAVRQSMSIWFQDAINWGKNLGDVLTRSFDRAADSFADMLMQQKVDWKAFGAMFIKELLSMIMQLYIAVALKAALQGWAGLGQSIGQTGFGGTGATTPGITEALDTGFASGGHVLETGIAKVHKGEDIVPAGGGGLVVNVIDNVGVQVSVEENPDERTYNVVLTALEGDGPMRRAIRSAAGRS